MSTTEKQFQSWALPSGVELPSGGRSYMTDGLRIRYPGATPAWIGDVVRALGEARARLVARSSSEIAERLGRVGARFLDPGDGVRTEALELIPATSGLSRPMAGAVLTGMASDWTTDRLLAMLEAELGGPRALDELTPGTHGQVRAVAPRLCAQIVSGSVPGVGVTALLRSLVIRAPTLLKPGRGDVVLPALFGRALREEDADLADAAAVVYWPGGSEALEVAALGAADAVVAYGDDDTVRTLRRLAPVSALFVAYHHRVSLAVVGRDALSAELCRRTACDAAGAVAFFDQRGCVSPQVIYVENGGAVDARAFAAELSVALASLEKRLPGGVLDAAEASAVHQIRGTAELLAASGGGLEVRHGDAASWTVIYDPEPEFEVSCVGRVVRVKPVADVLEVPALVAPFRGRTQTAGVAGCDDRMETLAGALAEVGVTRVARMSSVPFPPPWWHHDGKGPLRVLMRWMDLEE